MNSREDVLKAIAAMVGDSPKPPALIADALRDAAAFYARENPFKKGDLVTPRAGTDMTGVGDAHIVVAVDKDPVFHFVGQPSTNQFGQALDLRVLHWWQGKFTTHWVESALFEPWVDPAEKAGDTQPETAAAEAA